MKKLLAPVLSLFVSISVLFSGCTGKKADNSSDAAASKGRNTNQGESSFEIPDKIDLTLFSGTVLYAQLTAINMSPKDYIGKSIKLRGFYEPYTNEETDITYHNITVYDTSACCGESIEFVLREGFEYPQADKIVTVEGIFSKYTESQQEYYHIEATSISVE